MNKLRNFNIFTAVLVMMMFCITVPLRAQVFIEKTFTGEEINNNWRLLDIDETTPREWAGTATIDYATGTEMYLISKNSFADVSKIVITYENSSGRVLFNVYEAKVGDTLFNNGNNLEEGKVYDSYVWEKPSATIPWGNISLMTQFNKGIGTSVTIRSITITYDSTGARNLRWSANSATATLGSDFTAPTLEGRYLGGIRYSSSDINVATVEASTGEVTIIDQGETTITASAKADGPWKEESASYRVTVTRPTSFVSETIDVTTPGSLQDILLDLPTRPKELTITGNINATDINYINSGAGKIAGVTILDLSNVKLVASDIPYNTTQIGTSDVGIGAIMIQFYISDECRIETVSTGGSLGGSGTLYKVYSNALAGGFFNNKNLTRVILPRDLPAIGMYMFNGSMVENIVMPDSPSEIGVLAFTGCALKSISVPASVTKIGNAAFQESAISDITLPESCIEIGDCVFQDTKLNHINLKHLQFIGEDAFEGVPLTGTIDLSNITNIPAGAFADTEVNEIIFSSALKTIGSSAFKNNLNLKAITLPEGLESVGSYAFNGCQSLSSIGLPESLVSIGEYAFPVEWGLKQPAENSIIYIGKVAYQLASNPTPVSELTFKEGTVAISSGLLNVARAESEKAAFVNGIKKIVFPSSLRYIGNKDDHDCYSFQEMKNLEEVVLNDGLLQIGHYAFSDCPKLDISYWPESLEYIGYRAFRNTNISTLILGKHLKYAGAQSFYGCSALYDLKLYSPNLIIGSQYYWDQEDESYCIFTANGLESVTIGAEVEKVPGSFLNDASIRTNLRRLIIEPSSTPLEIRQYAFYRFPLTIDNFPRPIKYVGQSAFSECNFSCDLDLDNCKYFGNNAFEGSSGITSITLNDDVEYLGDRAFYNVATLDSVYYNIPNIEKSFNGKSSIQPFYECSNLKSLVIGKDVEYIGQYEFSNLSALENITFESRDEKTRAEAVSLQIDNHAFRFAPMSSLSLPNCRTAIGDYVFGNCTNLREIRFSEGLENIGKGAFYSSGVEHIDFPETFMAFTGENAFQSASKLNALYFHTLQAPANLANAGLRQTSVVYVPQTAVENYKQSTSNEVRPISISSFSISKQEITMQENNSMQLTALISPQDNSGLQINWTTSNPDVASVDANGMVLAKKQGEATITASIAFMEGYVATCKVKVGDSSDINDIEAEGCNVRIITRSGSLEILGGNPDDIVRIYTIDGNLVFRNTGKVIEGLTQGIYIVTIGNQTFKVTVN